MITAEMIDKLKNNIISAGGLILGLAGGFLYWKYVGCLSGTCPLQSNPWVMLAYGGFTGLLLGNSLQEFLKKRKLKKAG